MARVCPRVLSSSPSSSRPAAGREAVGATPESTAAPPSTAPSTSRKTPRRTPPLPQPAKKLRKSRGPKKLKPEPTRKAGNRPKPEYLQPPREAEPTPGDNLRQRPFWKFSEPIEAPGLPKHFHERYDIDHHLLFIALLARELKGIHPISDQDCDYLYYAVVRVRDFDGKRRLVWKSVEEEEDEGPVFLSLDEDRDCHPDPVSPDSSV